jgi:hypothetical protein
MRRFGACLAGFSNCKINKDYISNRTETNLRKTFIFKYVRMAQTLLATPSQVETSGDAESEPYLAIAYIHNFLNS